MLLVLANAGKTIILYSLQLDDLITVHPTIGSSAQTNHTSTLGSKCQDL